MSVSGRSLLRKHFISKDPIIIPRNQPVIALTEGQIHTVLKTISDETILSTFRLQKSLLLLATSGKILSKERCRHVDGAAFPHRQGQSSSEGEVSDFESPNEGYTSGAINTDDDQGSLSFCLDERETNQGVTHASTTAPISPSTSRGLPREVSLSPGSGYSLGDYAPLSTLVSKPSQEKTAKGPPRKRKKNTQADRGR